MHPNPRQLNPKTVRLSVGRHDGPDTGVCVMELASMLAGERFSDMPRSVCPALAAFLRGYNDWVGNTIRQRLYPWATAALDTRERDAFTVARADALVALGHQVSRPGWSRRLATPMNPETAGGRAGRAVRLRRGLHAHVEDTLLAYYSSPPIGEPPRPTDDGAPGLVAEGVRLGDSHL